MSSEFEKLASDLELLAKAQSDEAAKVVAAAKEAGVDTDKYASDGDGNNADAGDAADAADGADDGAGENPEDDEEVDGEPMGKSFTIVGDDGEEREAFDATALIKSMGERLEVLGGFMADEESRREHLGKSLGLISEMLKSQGDLIAAQAQEINELKKSMAAIGNQGVGRKAVVTAHEKPSMVKSQQEEGLSPKEFLAKAETACKAGRISGRELIMAETYLNRGTAVPEGIVSRVMGNQ